MTLQGFLLYLPKTLLLSWEASWLWSLNNALNHGAADGLLIPWQGHIKLMFSCFILDSSTWHSLGSFHASTAHYLTTCLANFSLSLELYHARMLPSRTLAIIPTVCQPGSNSTHRPCPLVLTFLELLTCLLGYVVCSWIHQAMLAFQKAGKLSRVYQAKSRLPEVGNPISQWWGGGSEQRSNKTAAVKSSQKHRLSEKRLLRTQSLGFPVTKDLGRTIIYHPANTLSLSHC